MVQGAGLANPNAQFQPAPPERRPDQVGFPAATHFNWAGWAARWAAGVPERAERRKLNEGKGRSRQRCRPFAASSWHASKPGPRERRQGFCAYILILGHSLMLDSHRQTPPHAAAMVAPRLITGGLSLLLVLAFALAAGVPAGHLLAAVGSGGASHSGLERAMPPQIVERQARRSQQERPVPTGTLQTVNKCPSSASIGSVRSAAAGRPSTLVREALLALPPPALRCTC